MSAITGQAVASSLFSASAAGAHQHYTTIVIGAGQAGLATGYYLRQQGADFLMLDGGAAVGASWANRWDTLRLFTPATYNSLPGFPFPADPLHLPHKDEVAQYFQDYVQHFSLPIQLNTWVEALDYDGAKYRLQTNLGVYTADHVVVAAGTFHTPYIPAFAKDLSLAIQQLHSSQYRNPQTINGRRVMVVGAGSSGAQIAIDLAASHTVFLSGRDPGSAPRKRIGKDIYWWYYTLGILCITRDSLLGRLVGSSSGGDSRVGVPRQMVLNAGVTWLPRVKGIHHGQPQLEDGQSLAVDTIIWATGFRPDYRWIAGLPVDDQGYPQHVRGVIPSMPGLYFVGLPFQYRINSHLLGGVGDDARHIVEHILE